MIWCPNALICIWTPLLSSKNNFDGQTFLHFKPAPPSTWKGVSLSEAPPHMHTTPIMCICPSPLKQLQVQVEIKDAKFRLRHLFGEKHFYQLVSAVHSDRRPVIK